MAIVPARVWLAAAVVVALLAAAAMWSAQSSQPGGPASAMVVEAVPQQPAAALEVTASPASNSQASIERAASPGASTVKPAEMPSEAATKAPDPAAGDSAPDSAMKQAAQEQDLRGGLRIGGHARLMDSFIGVVDVDESDVAKTINVHILQDEDFNYYFDLDSQTVPAGERVMFVVNNTHFTPDECW